MTDHNPLQDKASAWESTQDEGLLLRGRELAEAEEQAAKDQFTTPAQRQFLLASRQNETRRRRRITIAAGIIMLILAVIAFAQANAAGTRAADALAAGTEQARTAQAASTTAAKQILTVQAVSTQAVEQKEALEKEAPAPAPANWLRTAWTRWTLISIWLIY